MVLKNDDIWAIFRNRKMRAKSLSQQRNLHKRRNTIQVHLSGRNGARNYDYWSLVQRM